SDVANRCYSCGTCTLVCPSCYCFDVEDDVSLSNLSSGERTRLWDSCQTESFAIVATGENFRKERSHRVRHRLYRKYYYLAEKYGDTFCVGCGRCGRQCTADIDIFDIVSALSERYSLTLADAARKID
ncbi:MAG: 4Fe-4S dicluster domain-containing protein, partial [Planctomycetota bacterium]|nr:4Fe-4S dicluster domain-containing protein [Planctomycetota bacterium]